MEGQLKSNNAVIEFLTKQLLTSNVNNSQMKNCDRSLCDNNSSEESSDNKIDKRNDQQKKKGCHHRRLNVEWVTRERIIDESQGKGEKLPGWYQRNNPGQH